MMYGVGGTQHIGGTMQIVLRYSLTRLVCAVTFTTFAVLLNPANAIASEVKIIANPGMKGALEALAPRFQGASGHKIIVQYGLFKQLEDPIDASEFDVAITTGESSVIWLTKINSRKALVLTLRE
jgi:hypothetical protein